MLSQEISLPDRLLGAKRMSHAYLFCGGDMHEGLTYAFSLAKNLFCADGGCGVCRTCVQLKAGSHPDFLLIKHDGSVKIEDIRAAIQELSVKPFDGGRRILTIYDAGSMTTSAQNCLLKTLEEPPGHVLMLLIADNPNKLLATVLSRVVAIRIIPGDTERAASVLAAKSGITVDEAYALACWCEGSVAKADTLLCDTAYGELRNAALKFMRCLAGGMSPVAAGLSLKQYKDALLRLLEIFTSLCRDGVVYTAGARKLVWNRDAMETIQKFSTRFTLKEQLGIIKAAGIAAAKLADSANALLTLDDMLVRLEAGMMPDLSGAQAGVKIN